MEEDPVCGMEVSREGAIDKKLVLDYEGRTYYFCSEECKRRFVSQPSVYDKPASFEAP